MLAFQLIVALKRTHKPRSKLVAEYCHALEQLLPHFASGSCRIVTESDEFVYLLAKLSARLKLHNVPVGFTAATSLLEQPGASFFHQDMSFRSLMWLHNSFISKNSPNLNVIPFFANAPCYAAFLC